MENKTTQNKMTQAPSRLTSNEIFTMTIDEFIACKGLDQSPIAKYYIREKINPESIKRKIENHQLIQTIDGQKYFQIEKTVTIWIDPNDKSNRVVIDGNTRRAAAIYCMNDKAYSDIQYSDVQYQLYTGELNAQDLYKYQEINNNTTEGHTYLQRANAANIRWQEVYDEEMVLLNIKEPWKVGDESDAVWRGHHKSARGTASGVIQTEFDISHTTLSQFKRVLKLPSWLIEHVDNNAVDPIGLLWIVQACNDEKKLKGKYTVEAIYQELRQTLGNNQYRVTQNACKQKVEQLIKGINPSENNETTSPKATSDESESESESDDIEASDEDKSKKNFIPKEDAILYIDKTVSALSEIDETFLSFESIQDEISTIFVKSIEIINNTKSKVTLSRRRELLPFLRDFMLNYCDSNTFQSELDEEELSKLAHKMSSLSITIAKAKKIEKGIIDTASDEVIPVDDPKFFPKLGEPITAKNDDFEAELIAN